jgi:hypothetical protein
MKNNNEFYRMYCSTRAVRSLAVRGLPWAILRDPRAVPLMLRIWWRLRAVERILFRKLLIIEGEVENAAE